MGDTTTCRTEVSSDYRAEASIFWQDHLNSATASHPASIAGSCSSGVTGETQAAANYECGLPLLLRISIGLMATFGTLVLGTIAFLILKSAMSKGTAGSDGKDPASTKAKISGSTSKDVDVKTAHV